MQVVMTGRTVKLAPDKVAELRIGEDRKTIYYSYVDDPEMEYELYKAKSFEQAIEIYNKITLGWSRNWDLCLLQNQTK